VSQDSLQSIPKFVKVLILQHSKDREKLYVGLLVRIKDASKSSKTPLDEFLVASVTVPVVYSELNVILEEFSKLKVCCVFRLA
jgi:hypothetical protein